MGEWLTGPADLIFIGVCVMAIVTSFAVPERRLRALIDWLASRGGILGRRAADAALDPLAVTLLELSGDVKSHVERARRFNENAAHQLRTPLNVVRNRLEVTLQGDRSFEEHREAMEAASEDILNLAQDVNAMLHLARVEQGLALEEATDVDLDALLDSIIELFDPLAEDKEIEIKRAARSEAHLESTRIRGNAEWLRQLFANLLDNAIKFTPVGGRIEVTMEHEPEWIAIGVEDTGPGIAPAERRKIFERFHRMADEAVPGVGIGLALAVEVARAHSGRLDVESAIGGGSRFVARFPAGPKR